MNQDGGAPHGRAAANWNYARSARAVVEATLKGEGPSYEL
jgi:hypothetical protein